MPISDNLQISCPIRGLLKVSKRSKDGLTATEESYRVEAIRFLLDRGYPKSNFFIEPVIKKFGNGGRNSFRSDFAVLDIPVEKLVSKSPDDILKHALIICEVKRDNGKQEYVKETQVKPMLDFAVNVHTMGLYWDNIERRVFWTVLENDLKVVKEGPATIIPMFGSAIKTVPLTFRTIQPTESLTSVFSKIENILHQAAFAPEQRYEIILQLLLTKIFDEHAYEARQDEPLEVQDYKSLGMSDEVMQRKINDVVRRAIGFYSRHLPNKISSSLPVTVDTLDSILKILAPIKIIHSKRDVVQTFYMKFAKDLYKWDMAQYFTPTTVTDFLVDIINPKFGEHIADPACGSADFLVAAFRIMRKYNPGYADCIWGIDNSPNAVQVAVLNMLLNGDGKTNIRKDDSLENVNNYSERYDVMTCNPPFGTKILEKRKKVLALYDLGHDWKGRDNGLFVIDKQTPLLEAQETGVLFVELCVKMCRPGGRIAIILPNGYMGNRSPKYRVLREWILKHTRVAAMISLPRFTFKASGADVSASVLYLEKRETPIERLEEDVIYKFAVESIEKVGWDAGNKKAAPIYKRNEEDGSLIIDEDGQPIIDSDFAAAHKRIAASDATSYFDWLKQPAINTSGVDGWSVNIKNVYDDEDLTLDPKRYCRKAMELREILSSKPHLTLNDIVRFVEEKETSDGRKVSADKSAIYKYVELQNITNGDFAYNELRGWELPDRAKHFAEPDDIYIGSIWGSVTKWCYIPEGMDNVVVTNGCFRLRVKTGMEQYLTDFLAYVNSEGWAVQMRSSARGSDGLAEICDDDARKIIIPKLDDETRKALQPTVDNLRKNTSSMRTIVKQLIKENKVDYSDPKKRPSHIVLV